MSASILGAAWVPTLPHCLYPEKSPAWRALHQGYETLATHVRDFKPDVLVYYSAPWLSVMGTSFQGHVRPKGTHVDENWYDLCGSLAFDFTTETELNQCFARDVEQAGYPTKIVNYDHFPIDTGSIVANQYLNPNGEIPVALLSSWVYADGPISQKIGHAMRPTLLSYGKRVFVVAISGLSTRFFTDDIDPLKDKISNEKDDQENKTLLGHWESGDFASATECANAFAKNAPTDMRLNAYHWLNGIRGESAWKGQVLAYGPLWGTGAAVVEFRS